MRALWWRVRCVLALVCEREKEKTREGQASVCAAERRCGRAASRGARVFEREREPSRVSGERACCIEAMQQSGSNPGASAMRHHRKAAEQGLA